MDEKVVKAEVIHLHVVPLTIEKSNILGEHVSLQSFFKYKLQIPTSNLV